MTIFWDATLTPLAIDFADTALTAEMSIIDNQEFFDFEITSVDDDVVLPGSSWAVDDQDKLLTEFIDARTIHNKQLSIHRLSGNLGIGKPTWMNADSNGYVTSRAVTSYTLAYPETETVVVTAIVHGISRTISLTMAIDYVPYSQPELGFSRLEWVSDVAGYARDNAAHCIDDLVAVGGDKLIYTTQNHTTATYVRNPNCWAASLDLTCMSPWNSTGVTQYACTLITPCHAIMAKHVPIAVGATVRFVAADNTVVTRTVASRWLDPTSDTALVKFDSDVPSTIGFAKCLPVDWEDYLGPMTEVVYGFNHHAWLPVLKSDQEEKALIAEVGSLAEPTTGWDSATIISPVIGGRLSYYESGVSGDSGTPAFLVINNELVILFAFWSTGSGPAVHIYRNTINAALTTLGGGYQLTPIELSSFRKFV